jgi:hypothetical protein
LKVIQKGKFAPNPVITECPKCKSLLEVDFLTDKCFEYVSERNNYGEKVSNDKYRFQCIVCKHCSILIECNEFFKESVEL